MTTETSDIDLLPQRITLRLNKAYVDALRSLGPVDAVIDHLLQLLEDGDISLDHTRDYKMTTCDSRIDVTVSNAYYLQLREQYGAHSNTVSLTRLVAYYIDNELYATLNTTHNNYSRQRYNKALLSAINAVQRLHQLSTGDNRDHTTAMLTHLQHIMEGLHNGEELTQ